MNRMTEFTFSLADSFVKLFFITFPIHVTSEKSNHTEKVTVSKEINYPEKEIALGDVTVVGQVSVPEEMTVTEQEPVYEVNHYPEKDIGLEEITVAEETVQETPAFPEEENAPEEISPSEIESISEEIAYAEEEVVSEEATHVQRETAKRSEVKQNRLSEEYRTTEIATGLVGCMFGVLTILLALVIGAIGVTFQFNETDFGQMMNIATPIFVGLAIIGVILQIKYPKRGSWLIIIAAVEGLVAMPFLYLLPGALLLISGYMGLRRGKQINASFDR